MKSRAIALGASVIALTLTGGSQALATGVEDITQQVGGHTEAAVNGPAGVVTVEGNVKVPSTGLPSTKPRAGEVRTLERPNASVEANRRSGPDQSEAFFGWNGRGPSLYVDHTRKGTLEVEGQSQARRHSAAATVHATARPGHAAANRRAQRAKAAIADRPQRVPNAVRGVGETLRAPGGHHKGLASLRSIGREVGNPIALSLAGWMTLLFGGLCLGAGQLARRRRRFN
jgi:hypothetical protein